MLGRLGRWSATHRWLVLGVWGLVLVAGAIAGSAVIGRLQGGFGAADSFESIRGFHEIADTNPYGVQVQVLVDRVAVHDVATKTAVTEAANATREVAGVGRVVTAYDVADPAMRATDGTAQLALVDLEHGLSDTNVSTAIAQVEKQFGGISPQVPGATVLFGGEELTNREIREQVDKDTRRGELIALPITLVLMVLIFGGLTAAGVPLMGALATVAGGFITLYGFSFVIDIDQNVLPVTTVLALGLAIDYSLLYVNRFREERGHGHGLLDAIERTSASAGRTITFSGLTVAMALSGLFVFESRIYRAIAAAGVGVVLIAMATALTLAPALLGLVGRRVSADARPPVDDGFFARLAAAVQRHPGPVVVGMLALFGALGAPFLRVQLGNSGVGLLPTSFQSRQLADTVAARFPGAGSDPVIVVVRGTPADVSGWARTQASRPDVAAVGTPVQQGADTIVNVVPKGNGRDATAQNLVRDLRADRPAGTSWVTGNASVAVDFVDEIKARAPWALLFVVVAAFVLLFLMTGSVLIPLKALIMNVLSLSATFGLLVLIFQDGHLASLLSFTPTGVIETWLPVLVFAFAFGLSMDYEVFLLSRIKELHDSGRSNDESVRVGLQRSGRIISSAALLMVIVFLGFAAGEMLGIKQMGVALALAVIIDATLVRMIFVPATMTLLGDLNWWAPAPLRRFHDRFGLREEPEEATHDPVESP
ncbi:MAG TPA: MMPL family transporter [Actinomycetes bacterium]